MFPAEGSLWGRRACSGVAGTGMGACLVYVGQQGVEVEVGRMRAGKRGWWLPGYSGPGSFAKCLDVSRRQCWHQVSLGDVVGFRDLDRQSPTLPGRSPLGLGTNPRPNGAQFLLTDGQHQGCQELGLCGPWSCAVPQPMVDCLPERAWAARRVCWRCPLGTACGEAVVLAALSYG